MSKITLDTVDAAATHIANLEPSDREEVMTRLRAIVVSRREGAIFNVARETLEAVNALLVDPEKCHCRRPVVDCGNGLENVCVECLTLWRACGEPTDCPCSIFLPPA